MGNRLKKFSLLMWKNWLHIRRGRIRSIFEVAIPILLTSILVIIRSLIPYTDQAGVTFSEFCVFSFDANCDRSFKDKFSVLAYSPKTTKLDEIMKNFVDFNLTDTIVGLNTSTELEEYLTKTVSNVTKLGIQFNSDLGEGDLPRDLEITLRFPSEKNNGDKNDWYTNSLFPGFQLPGPRDYNSDRGGTPEYADRGFLTVQQALTFFILGDKAKDLPKIELKRYPYPKWNTDVFFTAMETTIGMFVILSFMLPYINTVRAITTEKEKQLKESMKIMGLPGWLHWTAWFCRTFVLLLIVIILMVVVLKINFKIAPVFNHSEPFLLAVYLILYSCSTITFSFFISVFFSKANTAAAFGGIVWFLSYLPYALMDYTTTSLGAKLTSSLLSNTATSYGFLLILKFEAIEEGIQWSNVWKTVSPDDDLMFGHIILMLIFDAIIYLLLALYVEAVFPGDFGVPQPWYFPFTTSYWMPKKKNLDLDESLINQGEYFETFTDNLPAGIQIKNLCKTFGSNDAVKNLNLNMYEGQITVLLGHNGAGKTTTMSMLTGMFPPTRGTAVVEGNDVRTNIQGVRDSMGLCLQHNVLFDNMTVREHLYFFGKLKGLESNEIDDEINKYIKLLELEDKRNAMISALSGGMKRKISVGIALCGRSKVVMLDEPTAGMDPSARRAIWDLLQQQKHGRTILLTTHFMDEADLLGDRIAIMSAGTLQCCGSSFFLKKKYGAGYYLIIDKSPACVPRHITDLLRKHIPYLEIESNVGSELTYLLPENESRKFEKMLHDLEQNSPHLGIQSYGVSLTTLEEVFMKVGADHDNQVSLRNLGRENRQNGHDHSITIENGDRKRHYNLLTGSALIQNQILAMLMKKFLSTLRSWLLFLLQILLPVVLLIITAITPSSISNDFPELPITLDSYYDPITLVAGDKNTHYTTYSEIVASNHVLKEVSDIYTDILKYTTDFPSTVKLSYIVGATFNETQITAWFNGDPYHSPPLALALVLDTLYRNTIGMNSTISFINHPLPYDISTQADTMGINLVGYQYGIQLGYGMAFVASFYIIFYIKERVCKSKHLQFASGMNPFIFWDISFLWDIITYLLTVVFVIITMAIIQEDGFKTPAEIGRLFFILFYYGCAVLPTMYVASYLFSVPSTGFSRMMLLGAITGIIGLIVMQVLEIEELNLTHVAEPLHWVLLFIPFYSVSKSIYDVSAIYNNRKVCDYIISSGFSPAQACLYRKECCDLDENYFKVDRPGIGGNTIIAFVVFILLSAILLLNEYGFFSFIVDKIINPSKPPIPPQDQDNDVKDETKLIKNTSPLELSRDYTLVLEDVTKYYKNFLAVNGLCLGIKRYECFGLLGVNGAGKTTTFKMMTGDEKFSFGEAWLNGISVTKKQKQVQQLMGYCPQFDALLDDLTARETLTMFGLIRGVPRGECRNMGEKLANDFDFLKHLDKKVKELSGGNKRKLSTAIALIGDPPVLFLDEPTTGMDPATKRYLWNALCKLRDNGKCIVLTSHSMEECEAMCTRLAIMVNGVFQCLGSTQRLKNKFAQGYALTIKLKKVAENLNADIDSSKVEKFVQNHFPGAILKEKHRELLSFQLVSTSMPWSQMFGILERSKRELNIEDYSLGQCSLEQVFLSFTKYQR